ncbi:hypothetical protein [Streptococcus sp. E17BB]|uniref:hypothetical protein n=1 Tax=Streptococcus sp. E17BB TaxID=3278714 RepID=UPI00359E4DF7
MKQTNTFIVLRKKEGHFLSGYENKKSRLPFSARWTDEIESALTIDEEHYNGRDNERYLAMAMLFEAEPIKVQAEYMLTTLDGQEPAEPVKNDEDELNALLGKLLFGGRKD